LDSGNISRGSNGTFTLGFSGGYAITSRFVLGVEVNGWTLESYDLEDPSQGESISNVSIGINYFPFVLPIFIDVGVGQVSYTNNSPNVSGRDKGVSWFLGSGFELPINKNLLFVPQLRYSQGNFTGVDFSVVELTLGIRWYSGKDE
jgi:opacity protein-like surface antigen